MAVDLSVPAWLTSYISTWLKRLHISHWTIRTSLALVIQNDEDNRASCYAQADINTATLTFRADIADTEAWRQTVLHELMHVVHARVDHCVRSAIVPEVSEHAQSLAHAIYKQMMESFIDGMADSLYWISRNRDFPDEYPMDAPEIV